MFAALLSFVLLAVGSSQPNSCDPGYVWNGSECIWDEPVSCSGSTPYKVGNTCHSSCPSETYAYFSDCVSTCPDGTYIYNGNCVGGCPARTYNGKCVDTCPEGTYDYNNGCVDSCPSDTVSDGNRCYENCPSGSYKYNRGCVATCPSEASYIYRGECRDECWKAGLYYQSPGSNECVYSCPKVYEWKNNTCIDYCAPHQKKSGTGCYDICPSAIPYADGDTCVLNCPKYIDMATYNCVDVCPAGTNVNGKRCEKETSPTCNTNQYLDTTNTCRDIPTCTSTQYLGSDYKCYDYPTYSPQVTPQVTPNYSPQVTPQVTPNYSPRVSPQVTPQVTPNYSPRVSPQVTAYSTYTPQPSYIQDNYTNPCGADQWIFNNTCVPMCKEGEFMMDGKCQREIINVTPSPSMCPHGTIMVEGGCKELASQSSTATRTAMPSRKPSTSSTPSRSAKPSDRPNSATSTPSASRTPKPSNRVYADISRKPLPSIDLRPPPANAVISPAPSSWPKKITVDIPPEEKPAYIEAKVKLPGGNITEMSKPEKIQDMQASLACTLRMPLENIRIQNISYIDEKGNVIRVDVDPTKFMMAGNGDIGCYSRNKTASGRRLRERQLQSKGAIHVDYSIIQPSDDILSMDTTQMNDVIATSPIMLEIATSVGSSSVENSAVEATYNAAPSTNPGGVISSTGTDTTFASFQVMVGGAIAGFVVFAGVVVALAFYYKENKRNKKLLKEQQDKKPVIVQQPRQIILQFNGNEQIQNPMSVIQTAVHHADSTRFNYTPETTRPLKATHKSVV